MTDVHTPLLTLDPDTTDAGARDDGRAGRHAGGGGLGREATARRTRVIASTVPHPSRSRWPRPVTYLLIVLGVILVGCFLVILGGP